MTDDLFGDAPSPGRKKSPFGDEESTDRAAGDPVATIEHAAARIRRLKSLVGAEGLTLSATRELLDHVATAFDAVGRALRDADRDQQGEG
jgi:flagellin-like hook-associated protein FlgL